MSEGVSVRAVDHKAFVCGERVLHDGTSVANAHSRHIDGGLRRRDRDVPKIAWCCGRVASVEQHLIVAFEFEATHIQHRRGDEHGRPRCRHRRTPQAGALEINHAAAVGSNFQRSNGVARRVVGHFDSAAGGGAVAPHLILPRVFMVVDEQGVRAVRRDARRRRKLYVITDGCVACNASYRRVGSSTRLQSV